MTDNREIILDALLLYEKGEYADKVLKTILDKYSYLEKIERSFINRVFTGTIERMLTLDYIIDCFSSVKVKKQRPVIRSILRMSVYQIVFMDNVPDAAAINEAVKLCKKKKFFNLSGFVNALLRKIAKEKENINYNDDLSVKYSCPMWLINHFIAECGNKKTEEILENSLLIRPVTIRTNLSKITPDELEEMLLSQGVSVKKIESNDTAFVIENFDSLGSLKSFNDGLFCIQDLSSQTVFNDLDESTDNIIKDIIRNARTVVDVCASPGGKTCHIADLLKYYKNDSCKVISRDLSDKKTEKIKENITRCGFDNVYPECFDALVYDEKLKDKADIVIADLPCSGLGVIGRKKDIKYRVTQDDIRNLGLLQREILNTVTEYVKKGGMLIFSTCTVNRCENLLNAEFILSRGFYEISKPVQIFNDNILNDGFFISRFIKR